MFSSGIKGNQRSNGVLTSQSTDPKVSHLFINNHKFVKKLEDKDLYSNFNKHGDKTLLPKNFPNTSESSFCSHSNNKNSVAAQVTPESENQDFEDRIAVYSIIGLGDSKTHKSPPIIKANLKKCNIRATHHEALQRIECEKEIFNHYQRHWFSPSLEKFKLEDRSREERIEITRHEFMRHIQQLQRSNVGYPNRVPDWTLQNSEKSQIRHKVRTTYNSRLVVPKYCEVDDCVRPALSCAKHCSLHIMLDSRQVLFEYCTAKFADNTQCSIPVFDITHELPLCAEHARKRDNYKLSQEAKPKKIRKKVKPSAMIRPQKRSKKKRRPVKPPEINTTSAIISEIPVTSTEEVTEIEETSSPELEEDLQMVDQVLALNENGFEQALVTQAHLLEETDINNVLSTIQVDEFSDFFAVNRNGEYEPSREEAEELEKALAAVDNDVKSLEKLSQSQGLLDSLLDEHTLAETLVQIPEMFHNGYTPCGDNMVAQTASYLLPIEPHSHS